MIEDGRVAAPDVDSEIQRYTREYVTPELIVDVTRPELIPGVSGRVRRNRLRHVETAQDRLRSGEQSIFRGKNPKHGLAAVRGRRVLLYVDEKQVVVRGHPDNREKESVVRVESKPERQLVDVAAIAIAPDDRRIIAGVFGCSLRRRSLLEPGVHDA